MTKNVYTSVFKNDLFSFSSNLTSTFQTRKCNIVRRHVSFLIHSASKKYVIRTIKHSDTKTDNNFDLGEILK